MPKAITVKGKHNDQSLVFKSKEKSFYLCAPPTLVLATFYRAQTVLRTSFGDKSTSVWMWHQFLTELQLDTSFGRLDFYSLKLKLKTVNIWASILLIGHCTQIMMFETNELSALHIMV